MISNFFVLLTPILLASLTLAAPPSIVKAWSAHRRSDTSSNWAGAVWEETDGTFTSITGTFIVPSPAASANIAAAVWVGIDGYTSEDSLGVGIYITQEPNKDPSYSAFYEWNSEIQYSKFPINAGDLLQVTFTISSSKTSATATIENMITYKKDSKTISGTGFAGQNAEWVIANFQADNLGNFGAVPFNDASASGPGGTYTPSGAIPLNIEEGGKNVTSVSAGGSGLNIYYVG